MRVRVERILRGSGRAEDVSTLFLALRHLSRGRATVTEMGDFFAHRHEKNKGIITNELRDFFTVMRVHAISLQDKLDYRNLPPIYPNFLYAAYRKLDSKTLLSDTGLSQKQAFRMLPGIIERLGTIGTGKLSVDGLEKSQRSLFVCLSRYMIVKPAFSEDRLIMEFASALAENNVLRNDERSLLNKQRDLITLTCIAGMHLSRIDLGDGSFAELTIGLNEGRRNCPLVLSVFAHALVFDDIPAAVSFSIFTTTLRVENYCEPSLFEDQRLEYPLEITPQRKLARLA